MIGAAQADSFGYADAKKAVASKPRIPLHRLNPPAEAKRRFCGTDWTMYLLGWKTFMTEQKSKQAKWDLGGDSPGGGTGEWGQKVKDTATKLGVRPASKPSGNGATRAVQPTPPVQPPTAPTSPGPMGNPSTEEYVRGYEDFDACAINRHCAPSSANAQDWADYMAGWNRAEQDWEDHRLFPESVRIQVSATATITGVSDGKTYHLRSAATVAGERMDRTGIVEFDWEGVRYSIWPGSNAQFATGEELKRGTNE